MYEIKLDQFEGPLDLLLHLIEGQKLDITQVSLSKIADQYIEYLDRAKDLKPEELADFLVIAAKLLLIKSRALLPVRGDEIEKEGFELEAQLRIYKKYIEISKKLHKIILKKNFSFPRQKTVSFSAFIAPENIDKNILFNVFAKVLKNLEPLVKIPKETIRRVFSLKEKIKEIQAVIFQNAKIKFNHLIKETSSKIDIIISFLALLELVKQRVVVVVQEESFEEITISRNGIE
ncbi:MAG: segregation and condensation protein A [Parcubacteria group bacterium Athens1014_10]|nr:MAG: segregation and condensation protein A [Parcubacteria group bacterium Athens1014_10]TSD04989.1 MAG: segregation and condensation protein A [Parcubacteria group bacterium Athens0714_12]